MAFQEFYCNASTGSNLNSGSDTGAVTTTTNGAYTQGGGAGGGTSDKFTAAAGTPFSGRTVGDYASIYNDAASAPTPFIGRITAINGGGASIDIDSTKSAGTRPTTVGSGKTAKVGGEWLGPTGASGFPFDFMKSAATNGSGNCPRVNFKNNATYNITAQITQSNNGPMIFQGYSSSAGDGGKATIDGGTVGTSYTLLLGSGTTVVATDMKFQNNGAVGTGNIGVSISNSGFLLKRVVVTSVDGDGIRTGGLCIECECYSCNTSQGTTLGGFRAVTGSSSLVQFLRCYSHDNGLGSEGFGCFTNGLSVVFSSCIADTNADSGFYSNTTSNLMFINCDCYNNGNSNFDTSDGITFSPNGGSANIFIINCNFVKNFAWGIQAAPGSSGNAGGFIYNCGFGSGGDANGSGNTTLKGAIEVGSFTYSSPTNPYKAPTTGDFRLIGQKALSSGRGAFTQTDGTNSGTVGYPDVGAAQHRNPSPTSMYITGSKK